MPRKTDSHNPKDWVWIAESDLSGIRALVTQELAFVMCRSKLAEVLEKTLKAELIRTGWFLEKTHDLLKLNNELQARGSNFAPLTKLLCEELAEHYFADRYPGFDLEEPDWPALRMQVEDVGKLLDAVKALVTPPPKN